MATIRGGDRLEAALRKLVSHLDRPATLRVGFLEGSTYPDKDHTPTALVAAFNEFGTSRAPPRPFFRRMVRLGQGHWAADLGRYLSQNDLDPQRALGLMGLQLQGELVQSITDQVYAPLAASTIARKGFDTTLTDTPHMKMSVNSEIKTS